MAPRAGTMADDRKILHDDSRALNLVEFWEQRADIELLKPRSLALPYCWKWPDIEPRLRVAAQVVPIEECERRALVFSNPGLGGKPYIASTLFAAFSLYNPGERAPVHRHTPSASRFILEGSGGFTTVEGEKCTMNRGDLIITPAGTWHDHGNEGDEALIWMDVLDVPLVDSLNATIFEFDYKGQVPTRESGHPIGTAYQAVTEREDHSQNLYGSGGVLPLFVQRKRGQTGHHSPMFVYRWEKTKQMLRSLRDYDGDSYDGIIVEYVDPSTGGSVMPTMSFRSQLIRSGERTETHRHTSSTVYCCLEGNGHTEVGGTRLEWARNDVFVLPSWTWHAHVNTSDKDAFLYSVTDEPTLRKLGLYREETRSSHAEL